MFFARIRRLSRTLGVRMTLWHSAIFGIGAIVVFYLVQMRDAGGCASPTRKKKPHA